MFPVIFSSIHKTEKSAFVIPFLLIPGVQKSLDLWAWFSCELRLRKD